MTKPWVKVLEKVQLFERAHSPNESNTESSGFKINLTECTCEGSNMISTPEFYASSEDPDVDLYEGALLLAYAYGMNALAMVVSLFVTGGRVGQV